MLGAVGPTIGFDNYWYVAAGDKGFLWGQESRGRRVLDMGKLGSRRISGLQKSTVHERCDGDSCASREVRNSVDVLNSRHSIRDVVLHSDAEGCATTLEFCGLHRTNIIRSECQQMHHGQIPSHQHRRAHSDDQLFASHISPVIQIRSVSTRLRISRIPDNSKKDREGSN